MKGSLHLRASRLWSRFNQKTHSLIYLLILICWSGYALALLLATKMSKWYPSKYIMIKHAVVPYNRLPLALEIKHGLYLRNYPGSDLLCAKWFSEVTHVGLQKRAHVLQPHSIRTPRLNASFQLEWSIEVYVGKHHCQGASVSSGARGRCWRAVPSSLGKLFGSSWQRKINSHGLRSSL